MPPTPGPPAVIAHRGASAHAPENTLAAFALAVRQGADAIELDVRATSDGELVVLHDETLLRTTGDPRAICDVPTADLIALDGARRPPVLGDVLDRFARDTRYVIDVKCVPAPCERRLIDAIVDRGLRGRVVVQSFDHLLLRRLALRDPRLALAALFEPEADVHGGLDLVAPFVAGIGACCVATDATLIASARARRLTVRTWTVNEQAEMRRLIDLGVDGLITDVPDRARALLSDRGIRAPRTSVTPSPGPRVLRPALRPPRSGRRPMTPRATADTGTVRSPHAPSRR